MEKEEIYMIATLKNCIILLCFTILAIVFKCFWIVFGAIIFWSNIQIKDDEESKDE